MIHTSIACSTLLSWSHLWNHSHTKGSCDFITVIPLLGNSFTQAAMAFPIFILLLVPLRFLLLPRCFSEAHLNILDGDDEASAVAPIAPPSSTAESNGHRGGSDDSLQLYIECQWAFASGGLMALVYLFNDEWQIKIKQINRICVEQSLCIKAHGILPSESRVVLQQK